MINAKKHRDGSEVIAESGDNVRGRKESKYNFYGNCHPYFPYANYDSLLRFLDLRSASLRVTRTPYFDKFWKTR